MPVSAAPPYQLPRFCGLRLVTPSARSYRSVDATPATQQARIGSEMEKLRPGSAREPSLAFDSPWQRKASFCRRSAPKRPAPCPPSGSDLPVSPITNLPAEFSQRWQWFADQRPLCSEARDDNRLNGRFASNSLSPPVTGAAPATRPGTTKRTQFQITSISFCINLLAAS